MTSPEIERLAERYGDKMALAAMAALVVWLEEHGNDDPIRAVGIHVNAFYGDAGLYLMTTSEWEAMPVDLRDNPGDWPHSTYHLSTPTLASAFNQHWQATYDEIYGLVDAMADDEPDEVSEARWHALLQASTVALGAVLDHVEGLADAETATDSRRELYALAAEHDEVRENRDARMRAFYKGRAR